MASVDQSWVVTTDCVLSVPAEAWVPERNMPAHAPPMFMNCTVIAIQDHDQRREELVYDLGRSVFRSPEQVVFRPWPVGLSLMADAIWRQAPAWVRGGRVGVSHRQEPILLAVLMNDIAVPVFGSPPRDWHSLGQALASAGAGGSASIALAADGNSVAAIAVGIGLTLFVKITFPAADTLGEVLADVIRRRLGEREQPPER